MDWIHLLIVFALGGLPVVEMKLSIGLGIIVYNENWLAVFLVTLASNILAMVIVWNLLPGVERFCRRSVRMGRFLDRTYAKTRKDASTRKQRVEEGAIFVMLALAGVPFPVPASGLYTALVTAYVFGLPMRKFAPWAIGGMVVACAVLTGLALAGELAVGQL